MNFPISECPSEIFRPIMSGCANKYKACKLLVIVCKKQAQQLLNHKSGLSKLVTY